MSAEQLSAFLGWSLLINIGFLSVISVLLMFAPDSLIRLHQRLMGLDEADWRRIYIRFMSNYKIAVLVFNLSPYLALKCMGY